MPGARQRRRNLRSEARERDRGLEGFPCFATTHGEDDPLEARSGGKMPVDRLDLDSRSILEREAADSAAERACLRSPAKRAARATASADSALFCFIDCSLSARFSLSCGVSPTRAFT